MPAARISVRSASARSLPHWHDQPEGFARELLTLRQRGAYSSTRKYKKLLEVADPVDHRIRDALRIYGAGPGRWSSVGTGQLQNLARNDRELPASLIDAVIAGDRDALARWGNPLQVVSAISRAALCAAPGQHLVCADFAAIESRVLAWLAGETWKLDAYRQFDTTGNKTHRGLPHRRRAHAEQEHRGDQHGRPAEGQGHRSRLRLWRIHRSTAPHRRR